MTNDGGQAFPLPGDHDNEDLMNRHGGMSLRDWFAGMAMQGILASGDDNDSKVIAIGSYGVADAMLDEREKSQESS